MVEPKISGARADTLSKKIILDGSYRIDAQGFAKEIWLFWNKSNFLVKVLRTHAKFMHAEVTWVGNSFRAYVTKVYGSPHAYQGTEL